MITQKGFPLVDADNIVEVFNSLGIRKWEKIGTPIASEDYPEADLSEKEKNFGRILKIEISQFLTPRGKMFKGFHFHGGISGTRVFTLLGEDLIPICGEFQHGCGEVVFDLPGGVMEADEDPATCAKREFEEESGIILEKVVSLGSRGMPISARYRDARNFSFIGMAKNPLVIKNQDLDKNEFIKIALIGLGDWLKLIDREMVQAYSASTTFLALRKLNRGIYGH